MIKVTLKMPTSYTKKDLIQKISAILKINSKNIKNITILKKSLDARKKTNIFYLLNLGVDLQPQKLENNFEKINYCISGLKYKKINSNIRPVIVGFGPSGMFCGLALAIMGLKPIIIEQGKNVDERIVDVQNFWNKGILNKFSNVQFGEGGAGTFSDGKLNTNLNNEYCKLIINEFYLHGAPKEILYENKPHIGSDKLIDVVKNIRKHIIDLGGEVYFNTKMVGIDVLNDEVEGIEVLNLENQYARKIPTNILCLCLGHSARDTFVLLNKIGMKIKQKPFAMGVRIEQKAENINIMQYGENYDKNLPNADYKLVAHLPNNRSMFTFCMCPGGVVVASSSNENEIVTNGMSYFARDKKYSNSALLVNVLPSDFGSDDVLAGIKFQEKYEKLAYNLGGGNFSAPAETISSFLYDDNNNTGHCSYLPKYKFVKLKKCLPDFVYESLKMGICEFNKKYKKFANNDDVLIGVETRSSCPLTLVRDENFVSSVKGIYPCGEGAGYAGGIISSAQDGIKVAEAIYNYLNK